MASAYPMQTRGLAPEIFRGWNALFFADTLHVEQLSNKMGMLMPSVTTPSRVIDQLSDGLIFGRTTFRMYASRTCIHTADCSSETELQSAVRMHARDA